VSAPRWAWFGTAAYRRVLADQLAARERVWVGGAEVVLVGEHPPVITLGRSATVAHIVDAGDIPVERVERGGEVTYHGPGQLMIYPIVRVDRGVVDFLERVAGAVIAGAAELGVPDLAWRADPAGVWAGEAKVAACGIHIARGVAVHGWAVNVATPDAAWRRIRPCGLDVAQRSLAVLAAHPITVADAALAIAPRVAAALVR
jgi:lipoyl(octanoyl) transferase